MLEMQVTLSFFYLRLSVDGPLEPKEAGRFSIAFIPPKSLKIKTALRACLSAVKQDASEWLQFRLVLLRPHGKFVILTDDVFFSSEANEKCNQLSLPLSPSFACSISATGHRCCCKRSFARKSLHTVSNTGGISIRVKAVYALALDSLLHGPQDRPWAAAALGVNTTRKKVPGYSRIQL